MQIDDIGWVLLEELQRNGRASFRDLGERVGLSAPAVAERVRRLERAGVITGYSVTLDFERLGLPILAVIRVNATGDYVDQVSNNAAMLPEVLSCHRVTGTESHVVRAVMPSTLHLEEFLIKLIKDTGHSTTITNIVTSSPVTNGVISGPENLKLETNPGPENASLSKTTRRRSP
jgi:Lrp/AsnC family leucine-responsive transcriptional regulator